MKIFLRIFRLSFLGNSQFSGNTAASFISFAIRISVVIFLWGYVLRGNSSQQQIYNNLAYFLMAECISSFTGALGMRSASQFIRLIKNGNLTKYLILPINPLLHIFAELNGERSFQFYLSILSGVVSIILSPQITLVGVILFLVALLPAIAIGFSLNIIAGSTAFWLIEAMGIKNTFSHVIRFFGGTFVSLIVIKETLGPIFGTIIAFSPFPSVAFTPSYVLRQGFSSEVLTLILTSIFWGIAMPLIAYFIWHRGLKHYEATGN